MCKFYLKNILLLPTQAQIWSLELCGDSHFPSISPIRFCATDNVPFEGKLSALHSHSCICAWVPTTTHRLAVLVYLQSVIDCILILLLNFAFNWLIANIINFDAFSRQIYDSEFQCNEFKMYFNFLIYFSFFCTIPIILLFQNWNR